MARFKPYDYRQGLMVPLNLEEQLVAGSLEYALHHLIEERVADDWFEELGRKWTLMSAQLRRTCRRSTSSSSGGASPPGEGLQIWG